MPLTFPHTSPPVSFSAASDACNSLVFVCRLHNADLRLIVYRFPRFFTPAGSSLFLPIPRKRLTGFSSFLLTAKTSRARHFPGSQAFFLFAALRGRSTKQLLRYKSAKPASPSFSLCNKPRQLTSPVCLRHSDTLFPVPPPTPQHATTPAFSAFFSFSAFDQRG